MSDYLYPCLQYPGRYIWDFWYYFESEIKLYHVFYLNAERNLVAQDKHHSAAQVGYGVTNDFITIEWGPIDVLTASQKRWDNTSIWTGDIIKIKNGFLLFYTSRNQQEDDGMTQNIRIAYAEKLNARFWEPLPKIRIQPDSEIYEPRNVLGDISTHAWRDPFLFKSSDQIFMLISAKSVNQPLGRKGTIGLLRLQDESFSNWEALEPIVNLGYYSEMEVPQLYRDSQSRYQLVYSSWAKGDFTSTKYKSGGLHSLVSTNWQNFNQSQPHVLMSEESGLYACRIIPELDGEIVGFDVNEGGIRRSGLKTGLKHVDRDFTKIELKT